MEIYRSIHATSDVLSMRIIRDRNQTWDKSYGMPYCIKSERFREWFTRNIISRNDWLFTLFPEMIDCSHYLREIIYCAHHFEKWLIFFIFKSGMVGIRLEKPRFRMKRTLKKNFDERKKINNPTFKGTSVYWVSASFNSIMLRLQQYYSERNVDQTPRNRNESA